jgi:hypothetical protein
MAAQDSEPGCGSDHMRESHLSRAARQMDHESVTPTVWTSSRLEGWPTQRYMQLTIIPNWR